MRDTIAATITIAVDNRKTAAVQLPEWARRASLLIPAVDNGVASLEFMKQADMSATTIVASYDTTWKTVYDEAESSQIAGSGADPGCYDITTLIRGLPEGFVRAVIAGNQSANRTLYFTFSD